MPSFCEVVLLRCTMKQSISQTLAALFAMACAIALTACSPVADDRQDDKGPVVLAAASLQEALEAVAKEWTGQGYPAPVLSFAATSALARQIESGAPADVFISADEKWMDEVEAKGLVRGGSRTDLLGNSLVLVAPAKSDVQLAIAPGFPLAAALGTGRLAMADPEAVPAGRYGKEALTSLGVWDAVAGKVAPGESVRAALALVGRGEAPLGVVYATDSKADPQVRLVASFPETSHTPIRYPVAVLKAASDEDADAFRAFLSSEEAGAIFRRYGFTTLPGK